jgi:hypothetical protein
MHRAGSATYLRGSQVFFLFSPYTQKCVSLHLHRVEKCRIAMRHTGYCRNVDRDFLHISHLAERILELPSRFFCRICGPSAGIRDTAVDDLLTWFEIFFVVIALSLNMQWNSYPPYLNNRLWNRYFGNNAGWSFMWWPDSFVRVTAVDVRFTADFTTCYVTNFRLLLRSSFPVKF